MRLGLWSLTAILAVSSLAFAGPKKRKPTAAPDRPPQYVLLAFDGSKDINFWNESTAFADTVKTDEGRANVRFTYFINPVYYVEHANRKEYVTPGLNRTVSCIGWSEPTNSFRERIQATGRAFKAGHEIGSHANAHCDQAGTDPGDPMYGHPWSEDDWRSEFDQFNKLIFNIFAVNKQKAEPIPFSQSDIVGFRAPKLSVTNGLWPTLKRFGFRYDTSKSASPTYWPQKMSWGGWNFPLAEIKIAGTNRRTFSMDFNWLTYHSGGVTKPGLTEEERLRFKNQMLDSYKYYFKINYFGGRAPIHIGHHFSKWNKGAYWEAMKDFTKFVCNKPEVKCVTYKEYADWLDGLAPQKYEFYRSGQFEKLRDDNTIRNISTPTLANIRLDTGNQAFEAVVDPADQARMKTMGWKPQLQVDFKPVEGTTLTREQLIQMVGPGKTTFVRAALVNKSGQELDWQTYRIDELGTPKELMSSEPIENRALQGEGIDAHTTPE
ncbi:MAG: hypothetical protein KF681_18380 [Bdellovibrionaceae bacterium]|nr:hypothetical protein [Pseudobdellovibrionaceae bacterium]